MDDYTQSINDAVKCLRQGGVIAYPTEAVYGLGCDPFNHDSVAQLLTIKKRSIKKGFILIASEWKQVELLIEPIDPKALARVFDTWPGSFTWTFPASKEAPHWITGQHSTIAIRISAHPIAKLLCQRFAGPLISTSANQEGEPPIRDVKILHMVFGNKIDKILEGPLGLTHRPTSIREAITGEIVRL